MFLHGLFFSAAVAQLAVAVVFTVPYYLDVASIVQASADVLFVARSGIQFHRDILSVLPGPEADAY